MALQKNKLKQDLINWIEKCKTEIKNTNDALQLFVDAYENYAKDAQDISGDYVLSYNKSSMFETLLNLPSQQSANDGAQIIENAIINFWNGATFKLLIPPPGTILPEISSTVIQNIVSGTLKSLLVPIFSNLNINTSDETRIDQLATVIDSVTKTIIVNCIGTNPSNPPSTIPIQGTIY